MEGDNDLRVRFSVQEFHIRYSKGCWIEMTFDWLLNTSWLDKEQGIRNNQWACSMLHFNWNSCKKCKEMQRVSNRIGQELLHAHSEKTPTNTSTLPSCKHFFSRSLEFIEPASLALASICSHWFFQTLLDALEQNTLWMLRGETLEDCPASAKCFKFRQGESMNPRKTGCPRPFDLRQSLVLIVFWPFFST